MYGGPRSGTATKLGEICFHTSVIVIRAQRRIRLDPV